MPVQTDRRRQILSDFALAVMAAKFGKPQAQLRGVRARQWAGARETIRAIYDSPGGGAGCCLHIIVDDGNTTDSSVEVCLAEAKKQQHPMCDMVAVFLGTLTRAQRRAFLRVRR
jgi:hypothetical protein